MSIFHIALIATLVTAIINAFVDAGPSKKRTKSKKVFLVILCVSALVSAYAGYKIEKGVVKEKEDSEKQVASLQNKLDTANTSLSTAKADLANIITRLDNVRQSLENENTASSNIISGIDDIKISLEELSKNRLKPVPNVPLHSTVPDGSTSGTSKPTVVVGANGITNIKIPVGCRIVADIDTKAKLAVESDKLNSAGQLETRLDGDYKAFRVGTEKTFQDEHGKRKTIVYKGVIDGDYVFDAYYQ